MQLKNNYWIFTKAISKTNCDKIIKACLKQSKIKGTVANSKLKLRARNCYVSWISEDWIYALLNPFIHTANRNANWNFQWDWNELSQFTEYTKNQFYEWHTDQDNKPYAADNKMINLRNKTRKLSLTLQLTDPAEYDGGDFEFKWFDVEIDLASEFQYSKQKFDDKIKTVLVKEAKELGTIIIFPSFVWHRITPITKGKRQSLVNWSIGKPFI
tara:strand:+ start:616 stop:1254 length:639 start_codon:yes stop_codon:yes gene_type:complete